MTRTEILGGEVTPTTYGNGLTRLEHYAGLAMQAFISSKQCYSVHETAEYAIGYAVAMMAAVDAHVAQCRKAAKSPDTN